MSQAMYEIHVRGPLPASLSAGTTYREIGSETRLLTNDIDQERLYQLVFRLRDLGIELLEIAAGNRDCLGGAVSTDSPGDGRETYEVRINGLLGPLMLGAIPHAAVSLEPQHTLVIAGGDDGTDLLDVLRVLTDTGVQVESVREVVPRAKHRRRQAS